MTGVNRQVRVCDYIAQFLAEQEITYVFGVTGGASIHLIHSIAERDGIDFVAVHHEQAGAMAADAYARVTGGLGAALATSGPGATNLITGIASAWYDSVPVLLVTGQVARFRLHGDLPVRQTGFQETPIVDMVGPVTKYVTQVMDPANIRYELEKATWIAQDGRKGPVLIDVPDDVQRMMCDPTGMRSFTAPSAPGTGTISAAGEGARLTLQMLSRSKRPVLILGSGIRLSGCVSETLELAGLLDVPICPSWAALDVVPHDHPLFVGTIGTHGSRAGNFAVQNSDLVIAVGARLGFKETGTPLTDWARGAKVVVVDVDPGELLKFAYFGRDIDVAVECDARAFVAATLAEARNYPQALHSDLSQWRTQIAAWKQRYQIDTTSLGDSGDVNPYAFMETLSELASDDAILAVDTGCTIAWVTQNFHFGRDQRLLHAFNNTPMGFALPAAVGSSLAEPNRQVICLVGDGSLMMNIQELSTVVKHQLPIVVIVLNNSGYAMVQQTQDQWLNSQYVATSLEGGLAFPTLGLIAEAFGLEFERIKNTADVGDVLPRLLNHSVPVLCEVLVPSTARVFPQCRFGRPVEDADPLLPRSEFLANMIVKPLKASQPETW